ncbi:MAG: nitroreductase family protein [Alphaproteobacteria bacterium]
MYTVNPHIFIYPRIEDDSVNFVLFNPDNRRRFSIPRDEDFPDILKLLLFCSQKPREMEDILNSDFEIDQDDVYHLVDAGILVEGAQNIVPEQNTFLSLYQRLVHNYPFGDYDLLETIEAEEALMEEFASTAMPPASYLPRKGKMYLLSDIKADTFGDRLSKILDYTFGAFGTLKGKHGTFLHKISPSGGARHPSEGLVVLSEALAHIPAGVYSYDFSEKALIDSEPADIRGLISKRFKDCKAAIIVRSRVERPMWRYREPRSYRPIVVDAGHIVETARLLCDHYGYECQISSPIFIGDAQGEWLKEPCLAAIAIEPNNSYVPPNSIVSSPIGNDNNENKFPNPAAFYTLNKGSLDAHVLYPVVINKTIPSSDLLKLFSQKETSEFLEANYILLPHKTCQSLIEGAAFWANHDWDLSLLAYLSTSTLDTPNAVSVSRGKAASAALNVSGDLINVMLKRFTDRGLTREGVDVKALSTLLSSAIQPDLLGTDIDTYVVSFSIEGLEAGVYRWDVQKNSLIKHSDAPAPTLLRAATIGQKWATRGAASIILSHTLQASPSAYNTALIRLGMLGQRICLKATDMKLGSFMTPALNDVDVSKLLKIAGRSEEKMFYLVDIGASPMSQEGKVPSTYFSDKAVKHN